MQARTPDKPDVGAYHVDQPSMMRRIRAVLERTDAHARILLVGDDDMTSVALFRLGYRSLTVVDFDADVLSAVQSTTRGGVRTLRADLRGVYEDRRPRIGRSFDMFVTDPPYGSDGLRVFTGVGLGALRPGGVGLVVHPAERAAVTRVGPPDQLAVELQRFVLDNGAMIETVLPRSQRSYHGTVSSVLVVRRTSTSRIRFDSLHGPGFFY